MTAELVPTSPATRPSLPDKVAYAQELANSGLLPTAYRRQPANVLYAVEYGDMLGLAPMAAITGVHVIEGKPTASAALISALVRRAGHRLRISGDDQQATVEIVRADDPGFTFRSVWTLQRGADAGLCQIKNGKPHARDSKGKALPWEKYPAAMLKARAISECARDACEEALMGMHYTPEEMGADVDEDGVPIPGRSLSSVAGAAMTTVVQGEPQGASPANAAQDEPDWDARIAQCESERDRDGLLNLFKWAQHLRPDDVELADRIKAAGARVKTALADEPVDAEVVDNPDMTPDEKRRHDRMLELLGETDVADDSDRLMQLLAMISARPDLSHSGELSHEERGVVVAWLDSAKQAGEIDNAFTLAQEEAAEAERDDEQGGDQ